MNQKYLEWKEYLKDKKIAVIGLGVSNIPLIESLCQDGCDVCVFDKKCKDEMSDAAKEIIDKYQVKTFLGERYLDHLVGFDVIFRSPSFLPTNEVLVKEKERGALITTEVEQVIKLSPSRVIGITGSKGKTTTTTIMNDVLKGLHYHTYLGGNIGTPLYSKIGEMKEDDIVVLELSSFQLMNMEVSPNISVVTNISPDHLDIHGSYQEYINAKKYIYFNQNKDDILVLNQDDKIVKDFDKDARGEVRYFGHEYIPDSYVLEGDYICYQHDKIIDTRKLLLKGEHNYLNLCAALTAIRDYIHVSHEELERIVSQISPVHHRLEFVREINGVKWYNDSASTTPDKALAGINAFDEKIVLIAGGYDKNISYESLAKPIARKVSKLILFGDTKNKIYDEVMKLPRALSSNVEIYVMDSLEEVVEVAYRVSEPGEVVLFSPASASFDMFQNAYQRGDIFMDLVRKL